MKFWSNCFFAALAAQWKDRTVRIRWKRNRRGRWHCYWTTTEGEFEFYAKGRSQCSYVANLWYFGEVKQTGSAPTVDGEWVPSIFERSDTWNPSRPAWRVALRDFGPWCYSRRAAFKQWIRCNLGFQPNDPA